MTKPLVVKGYSSCVEVNALIYQSDDVVKSSWIACHVRFSCIEADLQL